MTITGRRDVELSLRDARPGQPDRHRVCCCLAWRDAGGTHLSVVTMGLGLDSVDAHIDYITSVAGALDTS
jgi:hypothetical protein